MPCTYYLLAGDHRVGFHWTERDIGQYDVYHDAPDADGMLMQVRMWVGVDELTMRCIVEALKQDPRAGMEESDG